MKTTLSPLQPVSDKSQTHVSEVAMALRGSFRTMGSLCSQHGRDRGAALRATPQDDTSVLSARLICGGRQSAGAFSSLWPVEERLALACAPAGLHHCHVPSAP